MALIILQVEKGQLIYYMFKIMVRDNSQDSSKLSTVCCDEFENLDENNG